MSQPDEAITRSRAAMPQGTERVLNTRSLATGHRRLAELVRPGDSVLDIGCGTGAITRGIAEAVGPTGSVLGRDISPDLIAEAQRLHGDIPQLRFQVGDILRSPLEGQTFDIVTAARVLQWLSAPGDAIKAMVAATRSGGRLLILDYNHEKVVWQPEPPASMRHFYAAFLRWRAEAGMDNALADHLVDHFAAAGLREIVVTPQHEVARRGDPDFETRAGIWAEVAAARGPQIVRDGYITEAERALAESEYRAWVRETAESQTLYLLAAEGIV